LEATIVAGGLLVASGRNLSTAGMRGLSQSYAIPLHPLPRIRHNRNKPSHYMSGLASFNHVDCCGA
jgi:hypothetical protein